MIFSKISFPLLSRLDRASNMGADRISGFAKSAAFDLAENNIREDSTFDFIRVWFNNKGRIFFHPATLCWILEFPPPGWAASVAYMNAVNNVVLRAAVKEAKQLDFDMDFDEADEYYDTTKVPHPTSCCCCCN